MCRQPTRWHRSGRVLPRHAALLESMSLAVARDERWRFLELGCSLGAGGGDELSDIDAGVGYLGIDASDLYEAGREFAASVGNPIDLVLHRMDGWPDDVLRLAAEYLGGLQLDVVFMPAARRHGLPDRSLAVVDKDDRLVVTATPAARFPRRPSSREWAVLGSVGDRDRRQVRSSRLVVRSRAHDRQSPRPCAQTLGRRPGCAICSLRSHQLARLSSVRTARRPGVHLLRARSTQARWPLPTESPPTCSTAACRAASTALGADITSPLSPVVRGRLT